MNTFIFGVYLQPLTTVQPNNSFPMLMGSSLPGSGVNLMYDYSPSTGVGLDQDTYILAPTIYGSNIGGFTAAQNLVSGFHVLTYALAAPGSGKADVIYIDGQRATYNYNFTSAGLQTSGHLFLGSSNVGIFGTSGLNGTLYRFAAFPTNGLTDAQVLQISNQITQDVVSRGALVKPAATPLANPVIQFLGDSITAGLGAAAPYSSLLNLTNQPSYQLVNWGIGGARLQAMLASEPNRAAPLCPSNQGPSIAIVFAGTNDFLASTQTPPTVMKNLGGEIQLLKTAGCRVFVGTMLSRTGTDGAGNSFDSDKNAYDALILTGSKAYGADGVIDFAANPLLGGDGANANTNPTGCSGGTTFQGDNIHPTSCGQGLLASAASNALNYYFGFNQMNPHVVTAASYTMQAGDGYITASPTANQTLTLPDCTGQSGAVYTVTNLQSVFTVGVVAGSSSQLINGLAVGTVVPVPANRSLTLRDVPNPKTVSGCHWEM
jgi:lysophospholipase L1-like esterase